MYKLVVALVILLLVLIYQSRTREAFATDASGNVAASNITLSLTDLMTLISLTKTPTETHIVTPTVTPTSTPITDTTTSTTPTPSSSIDATDLYKQIRPSLLSDLSSIVGEKLSGAPYVPPAPVSSQAKSCNSDSMAQGVEFADAKVNLEDNSDYIRKDSIPCYNCSL